MANDRKRGWKKPITDRARGILNAAKVFEPIEGDDDRFLRDLIALHSEADEKIGVGIGHFEVRPNEWNGRTFWLVRVDGTATDFSFLKALSKPSPMLDFASACRTAVADQIIAFKHAAFSGRTEIECPITGEMVTWETCHIDHAEPMTFKVIVAEFAATRGDIVGDVKPGLDGELQTVFSNHETSSSFATFHRERATLRVVSKLANLSVLRRK